MQTTLKILLISISVLLSHLDAADERWLRGSAMILSASKGVEVSIPGGNSFNPEEGMLPHVVPGAFSVRAEEGESIMLYAYNDVRMLFEGEGFFSIERLEGQFSFEGGDAGDGQKARQSRMILNLRTGFLAVDSRDLSPESQLSLELPFGRVSGSHSVWYIQIDFDRRSGIYNFTLACSEGKLGLTDLNGQLVTIYPGQRISGAGSFQKPIVEVGEFTREARERLEEFEQRFSLVDIDETDYAKMRKSMVEVSHVLSRQSGAFPRSANASPDQQPIVIDFVPRPAEVTPYRGEIPLPRVLETETR